MMTTPSIRLLSESFPEAELTFLTEAPADQVLQENPFLDEILLYRKPESFSETISFFRKLRARQFDCVIDFFGNPPLEFPILKQGGYFQKWQKSTVSTKRTVKVFGCLRRP